jgi:hypothetical protein
MSADDWYRNKAWNAQTREMFFQKLAKARSQRKQYLTIQASFLVSQYPRDALELIDHYFATSAGSLEDVMAFLVRANAFAVLRELESATLAYACAVKAQASHPNFITGARLEAAFFLARNMLFQHVELALKCLEGAIKDGLVFPILRFKWFAASAILANHRGEHSVAHEHAKLAIAAMRETASGVVRYSEIGLVDKQEYEDVLRVLEKIQAVSMQSTPLIEVRSLGKAVWRTALRTLLRIKS